MHKLHPRPRKKWTLILGCVSLLFLTGFVITVSPDRLLARLAFFIFLFSTGFGFAAYIFNHTRRALILSFALTLYMFLRLLGLTHWLYPVLLTAILIASEIYSRKK